MFGKFDRVAKKGFVECQVSDAKITHYQYKVKAGQSQDAVMFWEVKNGMKGEIREE